VAAPEYAIVGRVRKAHGIRGDLVVEPITDAPEAVFASGRRLFAGTVDGDLARDPERPHDPDSRHTLLVERSSPFKGGWIVHLDAIRDRNAAELWRERYLLAPLEELSPPREDEVYFHDLLGMRVERTTGESLGSVTALYELPQGLMLDVAFGHGRSALVPYRPEIVVRVDVEAKVVVVDPPEGLIE
jgi:16S rRNA processing protein RimM